MSAHTSTTATKSNTINTFFHRMTTGSPEGLGRMPPTFGANQNVPFSFQLPKEHSWSPPLNFSPERAFPSSPVLGNQNAADLDSNVQTKLGGGSRLVARLPVRKQNALPLKKRKRESEEENAGAVIPTHNSGTSTTSQFVLNLQPARHDWPSILRGCLQICFSFCWKALLLYFTVRLIMVLQQDVLERVSENSLEINQEIGICALHYKDNLCATNQVPAMVRQCSEWETCMNRNPASVGRVKVGAAHIAEILNGFVEPISWKALTFVAVLIVVMTFSFAFRRRHQTTTTNSHPINSQNYQGLVPFRAS